MGRAFRLLKERRYSFELFAFFVLACWNWSGFWRSSSNRYFWSSFASVDLSQPATILERS